MPVDPATGSRRVEQAGQSNPFEPLIEVITQRRFEDTHAVNDPEDAFASGVWDPWNAKTPVTQRDDALLARLDDLASDDRDRFSSPMELMTLDLAQFVGMRLNEQGHQW